MGGGVSPIEWVVPPLALAHASYNVAAGAVSPELAVTAPGSPDDKARKAGTIGAGEGVKPGQPELGPRPQTGAEEQESRKRAIAASEALGGGRRRKASQTLTESGATLSGLALEAV